MANCSDGDPITWLNNNWQKFVETVQTLATKYGQEHKENIVGTISAMEAREALKKHKGNVWHAVTECIEQRQQAFNSIKTQGNYSREDIVTYLTTYNGNVEQALAELNRVQLKPFLLKILGSPAGEDNQEANNLEVVHNNFDQTTATTSLDAEKSNEPNKSDGKEESVDILRDIEAIIGSMDKRMEEKQAKQTEAILQTLEHIVGNIATSHVSRSMSNASSFSTISLDRIDVKSPIVVPTKTASNTDANSDVESDVKDFVSRHIQDIVPDVAVMVNKELAESNNVRENDHVVNETIETVPAVNESQIESVNSEIVSNVNAVEKQNAESVSIQQESLAANVEDRVVIVPEAQSANVQKELINTQTATVANEVNGTNENESHENQEGQTISIEASNDSTTIAIESPKKQSIPQSSSNSIQIQSNGPSLVVNKALHRIAQKKSDKKRIRDLEKLLKKQKKLQTKVSAAKSRSDSQNTGYLSDSTVIPEENSISNEETFSLSIVEHENADNKEFNQTLERVSSPHENKPNQVGQTAREEATPSTSSEFHQESSKDLKNRNLSKLVEDTKSLIQQMKFEIDEDIAMSTSEFEDEDDDNEYFEDESDYSDELGDEEIDFDDSDGWEDTDDDSSISYDDDELRERFNIDGEQYEVYFKRDNRSVESEQFVEANEYLNSEPEENIVRENIDENQSTPKNTAGQTLEVENGDEEESESVDTAIERESNENLINNNDQMEIAASESIDNEENSEDVVNNANELEEPAAHVENIEIHEVLNVSDENLMEHMLKIQQSLDLSSGLSIREVTVNTQERPDSSESNSSSSDMETAVESTNTIEIETIQNDNNVLPEETQQTASENLAQVNGVETVEETDQVNDADTQNDNENEPNNNLENIRNERESHSEDISSQDASDKLSSQANDTESEAEEISIDVSHASHDSASTADVSSNNEAQNSSHSSISSKSSEKLVESYKYTKTTVPIVNECNQSSISVLQLKKSEPNKGQPKNKIPVRRPSFSEPSASIRNIQNELMNKTAKLPPKVVGKKPSKIVPPKVFFKSALSTLTNKANDFMQGKKNNGKSNHQDEGQPSTANGHPKIPKKKYFETCFSDDYQTSDDEKPITSKKIIPNLVKIAESKTEESLDLEVC